MTDAEEGMSPVADVERTPEESDDEPEEPVFDDPDGEFPEEGDDLEEDE